MAKRKKMAACIELTMQSWGLRHLLAERMGELQDVDLQTFLEECRRMVAACNAELFARKASRELVGAGTVDEEETSP